MILSRMIYPPELLPALDKVLGSGWAIYRKGLPTLNRPVDTYCFELWHREHQTPLEHVAYWNLEQFPGNKRIGVYTHMYVQKEWRGRGIGNALMPLKLWFAKNVGYQILLCTVKNNNTPEIKLLLHHEWNPRENMGVDAVLWSKPL